MANYKDQPRDAKGRWTVIEPKSHLLPFKGDEARRRGYRPDDWEDEYAS